MFCWSIYVLLLFLAHPEEGEGDEGAGDGGPGVAPHHDGKGLRQTVWDPKIDFFLWKVQMLQNAIFKGPF